LKCVKYAVKKPKKRLPEPPAVQERDIILELGEVADLGEKVGQVREQQPTQEQFSAEGDQISLVQRFFLF
jgi:hypothetical protein